MSWFIYTLLTLFIYGFIDFFYKVAANHNCVSSRILHFSSLTVACLSLLAILLIGSEFLHFKAIIFYAFLNSTFFTLGIICKISSLKKAPAGIIFPLTKINSIFLILIAVFFLGETLLFRQWLGVLLSFLMVLYINFNLKDEAEKKKLFPLKTQKLGVLLAIIAAISTAISMLTGKFAAAEVSIFPYMCVSYFLVWGNTLWINRWVVPGGGARSVEMIFGLVIGVLNFAGYFCFLQAVKLGPLSLVQGINSNVFVIPILLSVLVYKEKLDFRKIFILLLTLVCIFLIKS